MSRFLFLLPAALLLGACAGTIPPLVLPAPITETAITQVAPASPFAPSADSTRIALVRNGLRVVAIADQRESLLTEAAPHLLAWSGDQRLAAAFTEGETTVVRIFAAGQKVAEATLPGHASLLAWRDGEELLAVTHTLRSYSFGGHFTTMLHRRVATGQSSSASLAEVTLKPQTVRSFGQALYQPGQAVLSPLGDEIAYLRLHDPPAFAPYLRLKLHHLEGGAERDLATLPMPARPLSFSADGGAILFSDGASLSRLELWRGEASEKLPFAGAVQSVSPGGRYWLVGDWLLRNGEEFVNLPAGSSGIFMADGRLLLQSGADLRLLAGLTEGPAAVLSPAERDRLLLLRKWRSQGLITPEEFQSRQQRIVSP